MKDKRKQKDLETIVESIVEEGMLRRAAGKLVGAFSRNASRHDNKVNEFAKSVAYDVSKDLMALFGGYKRDHFQAVYSFMQDYINKNIKRDSD